MVPLTSPFRKVTDWSPDPWATPEERKAWDVDRKRRWVESLSDRDWQRLRALVPLVSLNRPGLTLDDLDAPIRVGVVHPEHERYFNGDRFGTLAGLVLMAWEKA